MPQTHSVSRELSGPSAKPQTQLLPWRSVPTPGCEPVVMDWEGHAGPFGEPREGGREGI